jgi:hypothetical protein
MATAAAVLAFIWGGFAVIGSIATLALSGVSSVVSDSCSSLTSDDPNYVSACNAVSGYSGFFKVVTVGLIIVAILLIWGGVTTLSGKNTQLLAIGAGVYVVLQIVALIAGGFSALSIFGLAAPVLILVFLFNPATRNWVRAKGGKTF